MSETVRMVCPVGRKHVELWSGCLLVAAAAAIAIAAGGHWAAVAPALVLAACGVALAVHGRLIKAPVLEVADGEFHYTRGRYTVSVPFHSIGSYHVLPGRIRSLALYDTAGRPKRFPSLQKRRTARTHLPLTGITRPARVEAFMAAAGIPPRERALPS